MLTKANIMHAKDRPLTRVEVPIWGDGALYLKPLSLKERADFEKKFFEADGTYKDASDPNMFAKMLSLSIANDRGVKMFGDTDIKVLEEKNAGVIKELFEVCLRVSYQTGFVKLPTPVGEKVAEVANEATE